MSKTGRGSRVRRGCLRFFLVIFLLGFGLTLAGATAMVAVLNHFSKGLPDVGRLRQYEPSETTRVFASDGSLIATLFKENRTWSPIEDISPHLVSAVVAVEDSRFYTHRGVDPIGVARAAYYDYMQGGAHQGASTVTMQLARNLFLNPERSMERKIKEALLAVQIEKKFTKDEIMELYLNQIYFGAGAYGIEAAAKTYYNKSARDLSIAEASLLAGLPQAPSEYSPLVSERAARHRQVLVLGRMVGLDMITWEQYRQALRETLEFEFHKQKRKEFQVLKVPYFTTFVLKQLYNRYDEELLYRGGLDIYTTVDLDLQEKAEQMLSEMVRQDAARLHVDNAALVCIENKTGFIRAMVGGTKWTEENQFNRAWQARRQPGSSFKVFVYTTAVESGYSPDTVIPDTPVTYKLGPTETWEPKNSDHAYMGAITMRQALQHSRNVVAVKLLTMVGAEKVIDFAYRMGIKEKLYPHLSLALGAVEVSPIEMAQAYTVLPNGGIKVEATPVKIIYDSDGNTIEDHTFPKQDDVLSESTAHLMIEMMRNVVEAGTGTTARIPGRQVAGKTGTTDDFRDAWFVGFTPEYTTAVWVGNDDNSQMSRSYGGDLPARIWQRFMAYAVKNLPVTTFDQVVDGKKQVLMCGDSKLRANARCPNTYKEFFKPDQVPKFCTQHGQTTEETIPAPAPSASESPLPEGPDPLETPPEELPLDLPPQGGPDVIPEPLPDSEFPPPEEVPLNPVPTPEPVPLPEPAEPSPSTGVEL